jgi:hypothetical protein
MDLKLIAQSQWMRVRMVPRTGATDLQKDPAFDVKSDWSQMVNFAILSLSLESNLTASEAMLLSRFLGPSFPWTLVWR